jgi:Arc/MetJ-type ribon-helix-helix transcriptional regulator
MSYQLPSEISERIQAHLALGIYASPIEVLSDALDALEERNEDIASIQRGIEDERAGRVKAIAEFDREMRSHFGNASRP